MLFQLMIGSFLAASCGLSWKWGGVEERLASAGFVLATLASNVANNSNYGQTEIGVLFIDVALLVGLLLLALRSDRFWPLWAAAFQFVAVMVHVASMTETGDFAWAYAVGLIFWSYPVLVALMLGTWLEARYRLH